jgi:hypothetical protein
MREKLLRDKLGYKPGQAVLVLNLPERLADPFEGIEHTLAAANAATLGQAKFDLLVAFTRDQAALAAAAKVILKCAAEDPRVWLVYPKKSGAIATDLTHTAGWEPMFEAGWVMVAIASVDSTWSAVRFRPKHLVKSMRC